MVSNFSKDCKYFANISIDGKLKIWNTLSNSFEQEFSPDFHLSSPFTCLSFIKFDCSKEGTTPRKKKRRLSKTSEGHYIVLGTSSGILMVYSVLSASLEYSINSETQQSVSCLSSTEDGSTIYSGADQYIWVWNLDDRKLVNKWKLGEDKITSIVVVSNKQILVASKSIKLWNVETKQTIKTFTGHSSEVTFLYVVPQLQKEPNYVISGAKGDRILNCWNLNSEDKKSIAGFLMEDVAQNVSIFSTNDSTNIAVNVRSGVVHVYQHTLNGKCSKPLKPKTTIQVVSERSEKVLPIRIFGATFKTEDTLCLCYGTENILTFENVDISLSKKVQCLVRNDPGSTFSNKQEQVTKVQTPLVSNDVHYLSSKQTIATPSKRKTDAPKEIPMEKRLENLSINNVDGKSKVPRGDNVAQLLLQGLQSKDKNIIRTVLSKRDEEVVRNTVRRLPVTALMLLIKELNVFLQGKTLSCQIGSIWLKHIMQVHAGLLISNPELPELMSSALGNIEQRLSLLTPLTKLKGRISLLLPQVTGYANDETVDEAPLFSFNDKDSIGSEDGEMSLQSSSESENEWEEGSEEEESGKDEPMENNVSSESDE